MTDRHYPADVVASALRLLVGNASSPLPLARRQLVAAAVAALEAGDRAAWRECAEVCRIYRDALRGSVTTYCAVTGDPEFPKTEEE